jgi:biopolymer transport protein ExbD
MKFKLTTILIIAGVVGLLSAIFFVFTTTMSSPTTMELFMPKDTAKDEEQNRAKESGALTIMLGKDNHVYYYEGQLKEDRSNFLTANFAGIRKIILGKKKTVIDAHQHDAGCQKIWEMNGGDQKSCLDKDLVIVIKRTDKATYKNTVDILDEMTINNIKRYAMVDPFDVEKSLIQAAEGK